MAQLIDLHHQGAERVIAAWEVDGVVVDPGPEPCLQTLLEALGGEGPRALLLTHIHLDHAGAAGALVDRFPQLPVYVHELGAPHLADPGRLLASAERLYGDEMELLWGRVLPVPEPNLRPISGGELVEGLRVLYTPGHASHHVTYLDEATGDAYVGDVAGVRIPPNDHVLPPTPPPELDIESWEKSLESLLAVRPARLRLTHFGVVEDPADHLPRVRRALHDLAAEARRGDRESFLAWLENRIAAEVAGADVGRLRLAVPPEHVWLGLARYWSKRSDSG